MILEKVVIKSLQRLCKKGEHQSPVSMQSLPCNLTHSQHNSWNF